MDPVTARFEAIQWRYAPRDSAAAGLLSERVADVGRRGGLITYSDLVKGVTFRLPNLAEPEFRIDIADWRELDRAVVGDFLGYMSKESYEWGGFFASALVVGKLDGSPGEGFYNLLKALGLVASSKSDKAMYIWSDHVAMAHAWYASR